MAFVNSYEHGSPSHFHRVIPVPGAAGRYLAVGGGVEGGLATLVAPDGSSIWSRLYPHTPAMQMDFVEGIAVGEGFVLLSAYDRRSVQMLVRIDNEGAVLWSQSFSGVTPGPSPRMLRHPTAPNEFLVAASPGAFWGEFGVRPGSPAGKFGTIAKLIRFAADGTLLQAMRLTPGGRMFDIVALPDGFVLIGDSPDPLTVANFGADVIDLDLVERYGLVVHVDPSLSTCRRWSLSAGADAALSLRAATVQSGASILLAGRVATARDPGAEEAEEGSSLVARLSITRSSLTVEAAIGYSLGEGRNRPRRIEWCASGTKAGGNPYNVLVFDAPNGGAGTASVLRLDRDLAAAKLYAFDLGFQVDAAGAMIRGEAGVDDLQMTPDGKAAVAGSINPTLRSDTALLLGLDPPFECCKTLFVDPPRIGPARLALSDGPAHLAGIDVTINATTLRSVEKPPQVTRLCGGRIGIATNSLLQSPYLNLQAAGSDGTDSSRGILLRWFLAGALGDTHLPKGSLATTNTNFNKPDDFVRLYRAPWPATVPMRRLSFATDRPRHVDDGERLLVFETGFATPRDLFHVHFLDASAYATARQLADPAISPAAFIAAYGARPVEIELRGRLAIGCDVEFAPNPGSSLKVETRSVGENRPLAPKQTTSRRVLGPADGPKARLYAENLRSLRVQCAGTTIGAISFLCYDEVLAQLNEAADWSEIGRFALTDDTPTALARLEDPARFQVNGLWRKYNDGAFVNVKNYQNRWSDAQAGLRAAVKTYVQLSETDPLATAKIPGSAAQDGEMEVSYLDLLQLAATDFHVARMLGLGHVDTEALTPPGAPPQTYVHLAEYFTSGDLRDGEGPRPVQHIYISLPTSPAQPRMPVMPFLSRVDYGLTVTTASGEPYWLTDAGGYTPDGLARFIRLYPDCPPLFEQEKGFFDPPNLFDLSRESLPVFYGVEHRLQGEIGWRRPEIAHDPVYRDTANPAQPEARPVPFGATQTAGPFPHRQTEPGVHEYAVYGVNLFSRASPTGHPFASAATTFVKANRLLPPSDLQVQFIQPESPLVLTSADEQKMLDDLVQAGKDPTLVRLCFNYGFPQEANYEFGHAVEIFHRRLPPANVTGSVAAVVPAADSALVRIETGPYTYPSTKETIQPTLPPAAKANFIGGVLAVGNRRLIVEDIVWPSGSSGDNPIFLARRPSTTGAVAVGSLVIQSAPLDVNPGDLFMAVENMAAAASWGAGNPLGRVIALGDDPSWKTRTESFTRPDQALVSRRLRGIWESAKVDADPLEANHYTITFATYVLAPHPQSTATDPVNWFRGTVRVPVAGRDPEDRRMLKVIAIDQLTSGELKLHAVDDSGETAAVATGAGLQVHYLPGYKVHLHADPASGFDKPALMPAAGEGSRTTLLGLRSVDPTTLDALSKPYRSAVGVPQLLTAMEVLEPRIPLRPRGLKYATPPDAYGKASYTLTVDFDAPPFAVAFYRADALAILEALYEPAQQAEIRAAIFPAQADPYFASRFDDLFTFFDSDDSTADLAVFPLALGDNYFLPLPNAKSLELPTLAERKQRMKAAMLEAFVALTEQPLIYDLISTDPNYAPTNARQVFRDEAGEILAPGQAGFDLAPMAKRPGGNAIQFTDFTLEGSMNPDTVYFYLARELGNRMQLGDPSPIFGPVLLVNLTAPAAPQIRKIGSTLYDEETTLGPEVRFEVLPPSPTDPMARLLIHRTNNPRDALSIRTMPVVQDIDTATLTPTADGSLIVADDFRGDPFIPFGEPLYYRLAWVREVRYEDAAGIARTASVASEATATLLANLVDVINPAPPVPAVTVLSTDPSTGDKEIQLSWSKTTHNGTYYVCQLGSSGNWFRLAALKTNEAQPTFLLPSALPVADDDPIYYRFKIDVENSSGLLNLFEAPITVDLAGLP